MRLAPWQLSPVSWNSQFERHWQWAVLWSSFFNRCLAIRTSKMTVRISKPHISSRTLEVVRVERCECLEWCDHRGTRAATMVFAWRLLSSICPSTCCKTTTTRLFFAQLLTVLERHSNANNLLAANTVARQTLLLSLHPFGLHSFRPNPSSWYYQVNLLWRWLRIVWYYLMQLMNWMVATDECWATHTHTLTDEAAKRFDCVTAKCVCVIDCLI